MRRSCSLPPDSGWVSWPRPVRGLNSGCPAISDWLSDNSSDPCPSAALPVSWAPSGEEAHTQDLNSENDNLKNSLVKEKSSRICEEQKNRQLASILNDREKKIDMINRDIDSIKRLQQNSSNKNNLLQDEYTKLRNHIMILTDLNQNLIKEIDNVIEEDSKMKCILDRKERINSVLANNRCNIDQSLNNLDDYINRGKCLNCRNPCNHIYECYWK